jgi:hypothetical protein
MNKKPIKPISPNFALAIIIIIEIGVTFCIVKYVFQTAAIVSSLTIIGVIFIVLISAFFSVIYVGLKARNIGLAGGMFIVSVACMIVLFGEAFSWLGLKNTAGTSTANCETQPVPLPETIYFSIVTWTTVGYGDLSPCEQSRPVAAAEAIVGYLVMALLIAALVEGIQKISSQGATRSAARPP